MDRRSHHEIPRSRQPDDLWDMCCPEGLVALRPILSNSLPLIELSDTCDTLMRRTVKVYHTTGVRQGPSVFLRNVGRGLCLAAACGLMLGAPGGVQAAVSLSVHVVRGGLDLDFGAITPDGTSRTEELELTVSNTGDQPYRVYQELTELTNERGERFPAEGLRMQLSQGLTGTRGTSGIAPVTSHLEEIFISDAQGRSDTLLVAYIVSSVAGVPAGAYRGVLRFSVESADATAVETIPVRLDVDTILSLQQWGSSRSVLSLGAIEPGARSSVEELLLQVSNNTSGSTQLIQEVVGPLVNERGDTLPEGALEMRVSSRQGDAPWRPLGIGPEVVLIDDRGSLEEIRLGYVVTTEPDQAAGIYRGTLRFRMDSLVSSASDELVMPIELQVKEIFTMSVTSISGDGTELWFVSRPGIATPEELNLRVEIQTNMGRPYQVLAGLDHPIVLSTGDELPADALVCSATDTQFGRIVAVPETPVAVGYEPLYESNPRGASDQFVLSCRLTIPPDAREGRYVGRLRFSITVF